MNKKFLIVIFSILLLFSLASCKNVSIAAARKEVIKALGYTPDNMNIVGKYGEGIVVDITFGGIDTGSYSIDGVEIPLYNSMSNIEYLIDGNLYSLHSAYYLGYVVKEDLYSIRDRYIENNRDIDIDYPLVDPNKHVKRCIHKADDWKMVKQPTCKNDGNKILLCKKCNKELSSLNIYKEPHNYVDGKCVFCNEKEFINIDTYTMTPEKMVCFLGGYNYVDESFNEYETYVFLENVVDDDKGYYSIINKEIEDLVFVLESSINIKAYYNIKYYHGGEVSGESYLEEAYEKGVINKNILIEIQKRLNEENVVGKYIYDNYSSKKVSKDYSRNVYLKIGEFLQDAIDSEKIYINQSVIIDNIYGPNVDFYGKYNDYYVGMVYDFIEHKDEKKVIKVEEYEFTIFSYRKIYVFNNEKKYELETAYRKGIISKDDLKEIYEIYKHRYDIKYKYGNM
ncbi:MAG: hypothetical protein IJX78_07635 [Bacilli bacterium]|nr:hypothetical protein [Bacilli bacterium]